MANIVMTNKQVDVIMNNPEFGEFMKKQLDAKSAYWLVRALDKMQSIQRSFIDIRNDIIAKYAKKDEKGEVIIKGNVVEWEPEHKETANKEIADLNNQENDLSILMIKIDYNRLSDFSIKEMFLLYPFIEPPEGPPETKITAPQVEN